jgi:F420H(2)-dependent quinone reductase
VRRDLRDVRARGLPDQLLRAHPDAVTVELGGQHIAVRPRVIDEPERSELWQRVNDNYNGYDAYEQRAGGRVIPVVLLQPIAPG